LKNLYASDINLNSVPSDIGGLSLLEQLDLSFNEIKSLPIEMKKMLSLKNINFSHNKLENSKEIEEDKPPTSEEDPWDSWNWWRELESPLEVDLSHNQLKLIPVGLIELREREAEVILDHNPLNKFDDVLDERNPGKKFKVGWAEMIGQRPTMEDAFCIRGGLTIKDSNVQADLFALFDGHAGREAASFAASKITDILSNHLSTFLKPIDMKILNETFQKVFLKM